MRSLLSLILFIFLLPVAHGQTDDWSMAGMWLIETTGDINDDFSGTAEVKAIDDRGNYRATLITEDFCCGGNHARVLQKSEIAVLGSDIIVTSRIKSFIIRKEPNPSPYSPDNFDLRWVDEDTLEGTIGGWTPVRWTRAPEGMV